MRSSHAPPAAAAKQSQPSQQPQPSSKQVNATGSRANNRVGDWEVDDLLFWRALEQHPPLSGILRQVLASGWTLCIPPDTAIPLGGPNAEPRPTESFARMHVLVPAGSGGDTSSDAGSTASGGKASNSGSSSSNVFSASFAKAASFFSSLGGGSGTQQQHQQSGTGGSPSTRTSQSPRAAAASASTAAAAAAAAAAVASVNTVTRFYSAGRKDAVVYRKPSSAVEEEDDQELIFDEDDSKERDATIVSATTMRSICKRHRFNDDKNSRDLASADLGVLVAEGPAFGGQRTVARIVFEQRVSTERRTPVTFLVLDRALNAGPHAVPAHLRTFGFSGQSVGDAVEFLFDADSEYVADDQSLFTRLQKRAAEVKDGVDKKLSPVLKQIEEAHKAREQGQTQQQQQPSGARSNGSSFVAEAAAKSNNNSGGGDASTLTLATLAVSADVVQQSIDEARETVNALVADEHTRWKNAIVPAAYPLSCRRLDRSFFVALSCYVHSRLYQIIHSLFVEQAAAEVDAWRAVRAKFELVCGGDDDPVHLGLAPDLWVQLRRFDAQVSAAINRAIDGVATATNPFDKIQRLDQLVCAAAQMPAGAPKLVADDVVPLLAYYLLRSPRAEALPVHIAYVKALTTEEIVGSCAWSSHEYALATLEVAMQVALGVFDRSGGDGSGGGVSPTGSNASATAATAVVVPALVGSGMRLPGEATSQTRFEQSVIRSTQAY